MSYLTRSGDAFGLGIDDNWAKRAAFGSKDLRELVRELVKSDRWREERFKSRIIEQIERGGESSPWCPTHSVRGRHTANLAGNESKATRVECAAERNCNFAGAVPAQLKHGRLFTREVKCGREACRGTARVKDQIAITRRYVWFGKVRTERPGEAGARRLNVNQRHLDPRKASAQPGDECPNDASANDGNLISRRRGCIPHCVESGFHVCREHRASGRQAVR